jgi:hypothetical protein
MERDSGRFPLAIQRAMYEAKTRGFIPLQAPFIGYSPLQCSKG